jgi:hypothetical protein
MNSIVSVYSRIAQEAEGVDDVGRSEKDGREKERVTSGERSR